MEHVEGTRIDRLAASVAAMETPAAPANRYDLRARIGAALLVAGVGIGVCAYLLSHRTTSALTQGDAIVIAGVGVSVSIAGAAVYLRYGLSSFLRLWLARLIYENAVAAGTSPAVARDGERTDERTNASSTTRAPR